MSWRAFRGTTPRAAGKRFGRRGKGAAVATVEPGCPWNQRRVEHVGQVDPDYLVALAFTIRAIA